MEIKANYENKTSSLLKSFNVRAAIDYTYVIPAGVIIAIVSFIAIANFLYKSKVLKLSSN